MDHTDPHMLAPDGNVEFHFDKGVTVLCKATNTGGTVSDFIRKKGIQYLTEKNFDINFVFWREERGFNLR